MEPNDAYLDSKILASLRAFIALRPVLQQAAGPIAQYKVVLDANIAVAVLLHKIKNPHLPTTALEEVVISSVMELHAPNWLHVEMTQRAIPQIAKRKKISEIVLQELWEQLRKHIIWSETSLALGLRNAEGIDSKDIPYVALQRSIDAVAVLSRDRDISALGGNQVELEFVFCLQSYARAASYAIGIRVGGAFVASVSFELLTHLVKGIGSSIIRLPPAVKIALIAGVAIVAVHPRSREKVLEFLSAIGKQLVEVWPIIVSIIETASQKQIEAQAAIRKTEQLLEQSRAAVAK